MREVQVEETTASQTRLRRRHPLDRKDRAIATVMAGIRNRHAAPPRQKEAILPEDLIAMLETLDERSADVVRRRYGLMDGRQAKLADIAAIWALTDPEARVVAAGRLSAAHPSDSRLAYEWACAIDAAGDHARAVTMYHRALDAGLREPQHRPRVPLHRAADVEQEDDGARP